MEALQLEDDGTLTVHIGDASAELDLYQVNDKLYEITHAKDKTSDQMFEAILDFMEQHGLPRGSYRLAKKFADAIFEVVKKKQESDGGSTTPALPASTAPALSD